KSQEHWLILGASGSGKSTLLNILAGLLKPSEGEVLIDQQNLYQLKGNNLDKFRAKNIGIVFQKPYFIPSLTILENLELTQQLAGLPKNIKLIKTILEELAIDNKIHHSVQKLSVGQLQRLSIARAVLNNPKIIFADEPTSSLDDANAEKVISLLSNQASRHQAILVVATHDNRVKTTINNSYSL
ncbi:ATP-binding cassette domain-containing protein, partial [Pseudoxanthomonas sp. SGD-10]